MTQVEASTEALRELEAQDLPDSPATGDVQAPAGPACVQQALTAWVSSFRYEAPGQQIPSGVEWMMVTATKGT